MIGAGLTLRAGLGLLNAELGSFATANPGGVITVPKGNKLPNAQEVTFNGSARYHWQSPSAGTWRSRARPLQRRGVQGGAERPLPGRRQLFARATVSSDDRRWEFALWGRNLSDEQSVAPATDNGLGMGYRIFNAPRTYGFTVTRHFE